MSDRSQSFINDGFNHDFTDEDIRILISFATSPEYRTHTCHWVEYSRHCGADIEGNQFPIHLSESHAGTVVQQLDETPDVLTWLNTVLGTPDGDVPSTTSSDLLPSIPVSTLEALLSATSIAAQSTSATLELTIDDIARAAPRLAYDLHFTRDGALALRKHGTTSEVLEQLRHFDTLKSRMEAARDVLREAESWGALEAEVAALITEKSYARAASRLSASARSIPVSARTALVPPPSAGAAHEPRRALLTSLANQLEAALSPDLVHAVTAGDIQSCKSSYAVFVDIEREGEFRNYYYGTRRSTLVEMWSQAVIEGETESSTETPQALVVFYPAFLSAFLAMLNGERTALPEIFPDPEQTLVLAHMQRPHTSNAFKDVVKLFQATEEFAKNTERILEKLRASGMPMVPVTPSSPSESRHSRRRSMRMSMSWRSMNSGLGPGRPVTGGPSNTGGIAGTGDDGMDWDQYLFQPFLDFQVDFGTLERRLLDETLGSFEPGLSLNVEGDRAARAMRERAVDVFSAAEESIERCLTFTHGYASVGLVHALDGFVSAFVDGWTSTILETANGDAHPTPGSRSALTRVQDEELADLDYTSEDWSHFQHALHFLSASQAVKERLSVFEVRLRGVLGQVATAFRDAWRNGESGVYAPGATKGEGMLLVRSTLNSMELADLLKGIEQPRTESASDTSLVLLPSVHSSLTSFARANQRALQNVLLSPLKAHLVTYPSLPLWSAARTQHPVPGLAGVNIPTFSLSPSEAIQRVGDGLLNLPRLFEVYAEDDALGFEVAGLAYGDAQGGSKEEPAHHEQGKSLESVTAAWLSSLGHAVLMHLTHDVLPQIRVLSTAGAAQLSADLDYLSTIIRALGVEEGELEQWRTRVRMRNEELDGLETFRFTFQTDETKIHGHSNVGNLPNVKLGACHN
ncbi:Golgi complex component 7-domain-containing protein [Phlebopus sp. FC_14]|nr:Golgi complex component 7-domain-containing protein [Phlebopus sp. FC_14]